MAAGPRFSPAGPDADRYGARVGYPVPAPEFVRRHGFDDPQDRVGAFSHFHKLYPSRKVRAPEQAWNFRYTDEEVPYSVWGDLSSLDEYLRRTPSTGLLVARDDEIFFEGYQYGRTDTDRMVSMSISKTITAMLIGIAVDDGLLRSLDDTVAVYVPELADFEYGKTTLRNLLHMSSGVEFRENEFNNRDLNRLWIDMVLNSDKGRVASLAQFNKRIAEPGTRFSYASIEADVLGLVLFRAIGKPIAEYLEQKIWQHIGAESDAAWLIDGQGIELAHAFFQATLRDYARFGRLLAHDGEWNGRQLIPRQWLLDATTVPSDRAYLQPGAATPMQGYGYLTWLLPGRTRTFAANGFRGQHIVVDPLTKLVVVQTAIEWHYEFWWLWSSLVRYFRERL